MPKFPLGGFQGLDDLGIANDPRLTRFLENVEVRNGRIAGRRGIDELNDITTVSPTTPIIGLFPFYTKDLTTKLVRLTPTKVFVLDNAADATWGDITGTDLTTSSTQFPQAVNHDELLLFVSGTDRPRKYSGSGNTATLGGTPPFAKSIMQMVGFVMLGNVSDTGSFTDVVLGHLKVRFTEAFDVDWSPCIGHELILDETNGQIEAGQVHGIYGVWAKSDAVISTRFIGSGRGFFQNQLRFGGVSKGVIAPLSFQNTKAGIIFLSTDYELYITDGQTIKPLPPRVQNKLQRDMQKAKARNAFAVVDEPREEYNLFIPIDSDTWNAARIRYNFRTGEFAYNEYNNNEFIRATSFRYNNTEAERLVASTNDLVWQVDTTDVDDNGTAVSRTWETDWLNYGNQERKVFKGAYLVFSRAPNCRVKIGIAVDRYRKFLFEKSFDLRGRVGEEDALVEYVMADELKGNEFNLRITMYHYSTNQAELVSGFIDWEPASARDAIQLRENVGAVLG